MSTMHFELDTLAHLAATIARDPMYNVEVTAEYLELISNDNARAYNKRYPDHISVQASSYSDICKAAYAIDEPDVGTAFEIAPLLAFNLGENPSQRTLYAVISVLIAMNDDFRP